MLRHVVASNGFGLELPMEKQQNQSKKDKRIMSKDKRKQTTNDHFNHQDHFLARPCARFVFASGGKPRWSESTGASVLKQRDSNANPQRTLS